MKVVTIILIYVLIYLLVLAYNKFRNDNFKIKK